jgi:hypothetical protein
MTTLGVCCRDNTRNCCCYLAVFGQPAQGCLASDSGTPKSFVHHGLCAAELFSRNKQSPDNMPTSKPSAQKF